MAFGGILPSGKQPGLGERLAQASQNIVPQFAQQLAGLAGQRSENEALKQLTGKDFTGLTPDIKKELLKVSTGAQAQKLQQQQNSLEDSLHTIRQMKDLVPQIGTGSYFSQFSGETRAARAAFQQYGRSLIAKVSQGVAIRNQKEFDEYKKIITDPNATQASLVGSLDALEDMLTQQASHFEAKESRGEEVSKSKEGSRVKMKTPDGKLVWVPKEDAGKLVAAGGEIVR